MLYVTTRSREESFTSSTTLSENRGPDGGFFVPMQMPRFDRREIKAMGEKSFSQNVAEILNLLFQTQLDSWSVDFGIGRHPVRLVTVSGRAVIAETWHNPSWNFQRLAKSVEKMIRQSDQISPVPTDWLMIASRIAVLFGIFGELMRKGEAGVDEPMDVVVPVGDFSAPMAVWYARSFGLPIGNVICCCNENAGCWNLLRKGEIRCDAPVVETTTPHCDHGVPAGLERLISHTLGYRENDRFQYAVTEGILYYVEPDQLQKMQEGLQASVVGRQRLEWAILNLFRTDAYLADPDTALCYSGLMDYRAQTGQTRSAIILSEESPLYSLRYLAKAMGLRPEELKQCLDNI